MLRWLIGLAELIWYKKKIRGLYLKNRGGKRLPDFLSKSDGECCSNKKDRQRDTASLNHNPMYDTSTQGALFFSFQILCLCATIWVMTDFKCRYVHALAWLLALSSVRFRVFSPWYLLYLRLLGYPLLSLVKQVFTCLIIFPLPF